MSSHYLEQYGRETTKTLQSCHACGTRNAFIYRTMKLEADEIKRYNGYYSEGYYWASDWEPVNNTEAATLTTEQRQLLFDMLETWTGTFEELCAVMPEIAQAKQ